ncbi:hypothetical protein [Aliarcobacter butzleri]|nr:hypothetical protein [Aliarcobacter butzleri]
MTNKEVENAIFECENSINIVREELLKRLELENNKNKKEVLEKLIEITNK